MCGLSVDAVTAETIIKCYEKHKEMGGSFDLMTASKIMAEAEEKYKKMKQPPRILIKDLERFYEDSVDEFNKRTEENPLTSKKLLYGLKKLIEENKK